VGLLPPADTISASAPAGKRAAGGPPGGKGVIAARTPALRAYRRTATAKAVDELVVLNRRKEKG